MKLQPNNVAEEAAKEAVALPDFRAEATKLLGTRALIFPVRHHSPACALQLLRLLQERRPAEILIEGPADFTPLLRWLAHEQTRPPVAIYAYEIANDGARRAAYYPFGECSPEWVALRFAAQHGIPVRFVDLPFATMAVSSSPETSLQDEHRLTHSARLSALAAKLGCRDHEELWEHLFEIPAPSLTIAEHVARMLAYCELARLDASAQELRADGTLLREAQMAHALQQSLPQHAQSNAPVLLVLGGFHALSVALADGNAPQLPATPALREQGAALIPFSNQRLDRLNGYAAGMAAPEWQNTIFAAFSGKKAPSARQLGQIRAQLTLSMLMQLADTVRGRQNLSMPALQAAFEQAVRLANLRGRLGIAREDLRDAALSTLVEGAADFDGAMVLRELDALMTGTRLGQVPPEAGNAPLLRDFSARAALCRLKLDGTQPRKVALQLYKRPAHRESSKLLHACLFLGIPFALKLGGPDFALGQNLSRFHEHWQYCFTPATAAAWVEASIHGATVAQALAHVFDTRLELALTGADARSSPAAVRWLVQAQVLGIVAPLPRVLSMLRNAIAEDAEFPSLVKAALDLARLARYQPLKQSELTVLPELLSAIWQRALYLGQLLADGAAEAWASALVELHGLAESAQPEFDLALFDATLQRIAAAHPAALVRGAANGVLHSRDAIATVMLEQRIRGHLGGLLPVADAVAFLRGLLSTARELAWQQSSLLQTLNQLLADWSDADFVRYLPEMRLAFSSLTPHETDRVADAVACLIGAPVALNAPAILQSDIQALLAADLATFQVFADDGLAHWWTP